MRRNYIAWIRGKLGESEIFLNFAAGVIKNDKGEILLQKRGDGRGWGLPGGALELGESCSDAAMREVFEETGLKVNIISLLGVYSSGKYATVLGNGDRYQPVITAFYCKKISGKLTKDGTETLDLKYFSKINLPQLVGLQHEDIISDAFKCKTAVWK